MTASSKVVEFDKLVKALNKIIFGSEIETVTLNGIVKPTISNFLNNYAASKADLSYVSANIANINTAITAVAGGHKAYGTLEAALANTSTFPQNSIIEITNDPDASKNGTYQWNGSDLTKSAYDPLTQAKILIDVLKSVSDLEDSKINTSITHLLVSLQQVVQTIVEFRGDFDSNSSETDACVNSLFDEDKAINTRISHLLTSIHQIVQVITESNSELLIKENSTAILRLNTALQLLIVEFLKFDGIGLENSNNLIKPFTSASYAMAKPSRLIRIDYTTNSALPAAKGAVIEGAVTINVDGEVFTSNATLEVQGSSSASYPKKNWTLGFFADDSFTSPVKLKIGDVLPHDEWVFKSNWIDTSHVRNAMSYNLWSQIMLNRTGNYPIRDIDQSYVLETGVAKLETGATGHPVLYPAVIYINDYFYGLGSLGIGKKRANYNIPKNVPNKIHLEMSNWSDIRLLQTTDPTLVEVKAPSAISEETSNYFEDWREFCAMSQQDFAANFDKFLNRQNVIDFILFSDFIYFSDGVSGNSAKNFQMVTWNGSQWFFIPYDLDTSYGLHWDGSSIISPADSNTRFTGSFWVKVKNVIWAELVERYKFLRETGVFSVNNIYQLVRELTSKYTADLYAEEHNKWPTLPSLQVSNIEQITSWTATRITKLDSIYV